VFERLPRITWRQDVVWRRRLVQAADDLAEDLEAGQWPIPRCTGEEMLLHLAISDAEHDAIDDPRFVDLPQHEDDCDWDGCIDELFQDTDVLMLDEADPNGVEGVVGDDSVLTRLGELGPHAWFEPFQNVESRDIGRKTRR
jgi:hypothetical protein